MAQAKRKTPTKNTKSKTASRAKKAPAKKTTAKVTPIRKIVAKAAPKKAASKPAAKSVAPKMVEKPSAPKTEKMAIAAATVIPTSAAEAQTVANDVVQMGAEAVREFFSAGSNEAQKTQEKVLAIGQESAEHISRSADAASKTLNDVMNMSQENVEACVECTDIINNITKSLHSEIVNAANSNLSRNVELGKKIFNCSSVNDAMDIQSELVRANIDSFFNDSMRMTELYYKLVTDAATPLNERMAEAANRMSKHFAA